MQCMFFCHTPAGRECVHPVCTIYAQLVTGSIHITHLIALGGHLMLIASSAARRTRILSRSTRLIHQRVETMTTPDECRTDGELRQWAVQRATLRCSAATALRSSSARLVVQRPVSPDINRADTTFSSSAMRILLRSSHRAAS
jgi:hypothetical protein